MIFEKKKIKKLAKKTLEDKWYPIKRCEGRIELISNCAFCDDSVERWSKKWDTHTSNSRKCFECLIFKYDNKICGQIRGRMMPHEILIVIKQLEILAKRGKL